MQAHVIPPPLVPQESPWSSPNKSRKRKSSVDDEMECSASSSSANSPVPTHRHIMATPSKRLRLIWTVEETTTNPLSPSSAPAHPSTTTNPSSPAKRHAGSPTNTSTTTTGDSLITTTTTTTTTSANTTTTTTSKEIVLPLNRILETLNKQELLNIITSLVDQHPGLESPVAALLPRPTLSSASEHLKQCQKRLESSYPYSKEYGQDNRSDYAHNRVRGHLAELREILSLYLTYFTEPASYPSDQVHEYPTGAFGFLVIAFKTALAMPVWNSHEHNESSRYEVLRWVAKGWRVAIAEIRRRVSEEGRMYGASLVGEWARDLAGMVNEVKGGFGFAEVMEEFRIYLGWMIGIGPFPSQQMLQQQQQQHQVQHVQHHQQQQHQSQQQSQVVGGAAGVGFGFGFGGVGANVAAAAPAASASGFSFFPMMTGGSTRLL
ncbi:Tethering factor for nuclear proteasome sts1 [Blyttiomyces sp. JEL0837]|nr:Tethering factor for nuclear proteasome sts1 [Blyttiomyces sp. JEL0837]